MSIPAEPQAQARWITAPTFLGALGAGAVVIVYGVLSVELPEGSRKWLLGSGAVWIFASTLVGDILEQRFLRPLKEMRDDLESRLAALEVTRRFPTRSFQVNGAAWAVGSIGLVTSYAVLTEAESRLALELLVIGVGTAPLASILMALVVVPRSWAVATRLAEQLPPERVDAVLEVDRGGVEGAFRFVGAALTAVPVILMLHWLVFALSPARVAAGEVSLAAPVFLLLMTFAVAVFAARSISSSLTEPLAVIEGEANRIARGGPRSRAPMARVVADWELGRIAIALGAMHRGALGIVERMSRGSERIRQASAGLGESAVSSRSGAVEQSALLIETSATMEELASSAGHVANMARGVSGAAHNTAAAVERGRAGIAQLEEASAEVGRVHGSLTVAVETLAERAGQIGRIADFMRGIGQRAETLAVNAELEGTRAGEAGRGFALVAVELRRVATSVVTAGEEIEEAVTEIDEATHQASEGVQSGVGGLEMAQGAASAATAALGRILDLAHSCLVEADTISGATVSQQSGTEQLARTMAQLLELVTVSERSVESLEEANGTLARLADGLSAAAGRFGIDGGDAGEGRLG